MLQTPFKQTYSSVADGVVLNGVEVVRGRMWVGDGLRPGVAGVAVLLVVVDQLKIKTQKPRMDPCQDLLTGH